jgi:hypothetical protein
LLHKELQFFKIVYKVSNMKPVLAIMKSSFSLRGQTPYLSALDFCNSLV